MNIQSATAIAHPNIAFIKYWGNIDDALRLPRNGSISMNLQELTTRTTVTLDPSLPRDIFDLNGVRQNGDALQRVTDHLNLIRGIRGISTRAHIHSQNDFPAESGIASSAAAFAALTVAAVRVVGIEMSEKDLSRIARRGSGSACRSIPQGFVEWLRGSSDKDSYAISIAAPDHWPLSDCIALVDTTNKKVTSSQGHRASSSSPIQQGRVLDAPRRLERCRDAIMARDFSALAEVMEQDSNLLHAVPMTSVPAVYYWQTVTLDIMQAVIAWRQTGIPVAFTIDAGPNVHVICEGSVSSLVREKLLDIPGVQDVLVAHPGGKAMLV